MNKISIIGLILVGGCILIFVGYGIYLLYEFIGSMLPLPVKIAIILGLIGIVALFVGAIKDRIEEVKGR